MGLMFVVLVGFIGPPLGLVLLLVGMLARYLHKKRIALSDDRPGWPLVLIYIGIATLLAGLLMYWQLMNTNFSH